MIIYFSVFAKGPEILIKSFWESRTLFSKRVLAAGGKMNHELYIGHQQ
jgi:hypothetical protein